MSFRIRWLLVLAAPRVVAGAASSVASPVRPVPGKFAK